MDISIIDTMNKINDKINNQYDTIGKIGECAIVSKDSDGYIHLKLTCNNQDDYYTIEYYSDDGWYVDPKNLTEDNFWDMWSEWNGHICGGIYGDDIGYGEDDSREWNRIISKYPLVDVEDLKNLPKGIYCVCN